MLFVWGLLVVGVDEGVSGRDMVADSTWERVLVTVGVFLETLSVIGSVEVGDWEGDMVFDSEGVGAVAVPLGWLREWELWETVGEGEGEGVGVWVMGSDRVELGERVGEGV